MKLPLHSFIRPYVVGLEQQGQSINNIYTTMFGTYEYSYSDNFNHIFPQNHRQLFHYILQLFATISNLFRHAFQQRRAIQVTLVFPYRCGPTRAMTS